MAGMSIEEILAFEDLERQEVTVSEWGGRTVWVRSLRADERAEIERLFSKRKPSEDPGGFRRELLIRTLVTEDGQPLIGTPEQASRLMTKDARAVESLVNVALRLSGFTKDEAEQLGNG